MSKITIHRGTHQIGGGCTEIVSGDERILIDLGANLPNTDAIISDDELLAQVFDGRKVDGILFSHIHGDHYGLFRFVPEDVPMYLGPLAKDILETLIPRLDHVTEKKGMPHVQRMSAYEDGKKIDTFKNITVTPILVDHSAPDAYMFLVEAGGKHILFTGDFRDHGAFGSEDGFWNTLKERVPSGIDLLLTEGTVLSRALESNTDLPSTEAQLGEEAAAIFQKHKYNFVLVSATNLDSVMEFYQHTPKTSCFVCDDYQAEVMLKAMIARKDHSLYQPSPDHRTIYIMWKSKKAIEDTQKFCNKLSEMAEHAGVALDFHMADSSQMYRDGFVMLVRPYRNPNRKTVFETMRDSFYPVDGQIIYSMWKGYLTSEHANQDIIDYIGDRPFVSLHTSGHASTDTIARLIETVDPKWIVPMHTERAEEFSSVPEFARWSDRVRVLADGEVLDLEEL